MRNQINNQNKKPVVSVKLIAKVSPDTFSLYKPNLLKKLQCDYYYQGHLTLANQITVGYEQRIIIIPNCWFLTVVFHLLMIGSIGFG